MTIIGYKASPEQFGAQALLDYAVAAEKAGFDAIDVSDHFHPWSEEGQAPFTWTWLGAAAARTSKIRLGTGLTCPILRYHPSIVAQAAATLAVMAPGRAFLGVGTGEALNEYSAVGAWPSYKTRQSMLKEAIDLMRQLWTGRDITFAGDYYETHKARLYTLPKEPIPVYISSLVPGSAEFAGRYGDGLITAGGHEPEHYQKIFTAFDRGAQAAGKDPKRMPRLIEVRVAYAQDLEAEIRQVKKYWAGTFIPAMYTQRIYTAEMSAKNGKSVGAEAIRQAGCFSSEAEDHVRFLKQYIDMGFNEIYVHCASADQPGFLARYAHDVISQVK